MQKDFKSFYKELKLIDQCGFEEVAFHDDGKRDLYDNPKPHSFEVHVSDHKDGRLFDLIGYGSSESEAVHDLVKIVNNLIYDLYVVRHTLYKYRAVSNG